MTHAFPTRRSSDLQLQTRAQRLDLLRIELPHRLQAQGVVLHELALVDEYQAMQIACRLLDCVEHSTLTCLCGPLFSDHLHISCTPQSATDLSSCLFVCITKSEARACNASSQSLWMLHSPFFSKS